MRVVPRLNEEVNEEWISDKARFQYDGLKRQRLHTCYVKDPATGKLRASGWQEALGAVAERVRSVQGNEIRAVAGRLADAESMVLLRDLLHRLGSGSLQAEGAFAGLDADSRGQYVMNSGIAGIEQADRILLVGTNPRTEAPVLNARLRKAWTNGTQVAQLGPAADLTFKTDHLGDSPALLDDLVAGKHPYAAELKSAKRPMVIVGAGVLHRPDRDAVLRRLHELAERAGLVREGWNGFNVLQDSAARVAALDLGFVPSARARASAAAPKVVFLLGSDDFAEEDVPQGAFVVYLGHHGERGAARADVVLPGAAYTEKSGTYVNTEGRVQRTRAAVPLVGDAREDWRVIRALSEVLGCPLPQDSLDAVRARLADVAPHFARVDHVERPIWLGDYAKALAARVQAAIDTKQPLTSAVPNFYQTDVISRASLTMAKCVQARKEARQLA